jgi:hypothetical protein
MLILSIFMDDRQSSVLLSGDFPSNPLLPGNRMRINSLFGRHNPAQARIEPTKSKVADSSATSRSRVLESFGEPMADDEYAMGHGVQEDLRGSDAVFGLIGTSASVSVDDTDTRARRTREGMASDTDDLMKSLYGQYCRALDDPHASLGRDWTTQAMSPGDYGADPTSITDYAHKPASSFESIETFLTGAYKMEHAFGPMGIDEARELVATEPVPEILRLFAPAEYTASMQRRPSALPPALARREHHALGIDSPLSVPHSTTFHNDAS